jgi:glucokinase
MIKKELNIGVDVGGTFIKFGIINENGKLMFRTKIKTLTEGGSDPMLISIIETIDLFLMDSGLTISDIGSIGMGFPGTTDIKNGIVLYAPNIFWKDVEVVKKVREHFSIPVYIGQDSRAAAWAEYLVGAGKGYSCISGITLGTGIGCGLILNGSLYHGGLLAAGEFGHQIVEVNGFPCNCGRNGCLEAYAGGLAILKAAMKISGIERLINKPANEISVSDVFSLAGNGNTEALGIIDSVVKYLGIGLVNLINLTSLELISLTGGISNAPDELLFNPLKRFVQERAYPVVANRVKIVKSILGDDAPLIGASLLHLSQNEK